MKINVNNIEKLKIIKITPHCIIVENPSGQKGSVFISEVANSYIVNLEVIYNVGDIIYGYLTKKDGYKRYYSLKVGHTSDSKFVDESGGGNLALLHFINKLEKNLQK